MIQKKTLTLMISILLIISASSGTLLLVYGYSLRQASNEFEDLAKVFQDSNKEGVKIKQEKPELSVARDQVIEKEPEVTIIFDDLYDRNNDITAWLSIPGTSLNYPVMHTPEQPEYYLYRNFEKDYSVSGVPFLDGKSSLEPPTDNLLIHGHNMKNGSMFAQLLSYQDEAFLKAHPSIEFYTFDEKRTYDIISVFPAEVYKSSNFNYHDFIQAKDQADFDNYVSKVKEMSLFETGLGAEYGEELMTLSTCAYHTNNGRFVVVAKERED